MSKVKNIYDDYYGANLSKSVIGDFEMKISLKSDQLVSFKPRRLLFYKKIKLQESFDNLSSDGVLRS